MQLAFMQLPPLPSEVLGKKALRLALKVMLEAEGINLFVAPYVSPKGVNLIISQDSHLSEETWKQRVYSFGKKVASEQKKSVHLSFMPMQTEVL